MFQVRSGLIPTTDGVRKYVSLAAAVAFFGLFAAGPAAAQMPEGCPAPAPQAIDFSQPLNLDLIKNRLVYYRCTQYDTDVAKTLAEARDWVEMRAPQVGKPAIVLDIDETSLSNWARIYKNHFAFFLGGPCDLADKYAACGEQAWEESAQAPALKPTLDLFNFAKCKDQPPRTNCTNVAVFFITGRLQVAKIKEATEQNLEQAGYHDWDGLYLRDPSTLGHPVADYKTAARIDIESRLGYMIIANIGDQESDLRCGNAGRCDRAERRFKVPNPFYYIP
ncbi:MAG: HAD family acid phosphatase [Xanthobacteraceae bacterium]|jgi:acid phosphatase